MPNRVTCGICSQEVPANGAYRPCGDLGVDIMCFACVFVYSMNGAGCGLCGAQMVMGFIATQNSDGGPVQPMAMCPTCISGCQEHASETIVEGAELGRGRLPMPESSENN